MRVVVLVALAFFLAPVLSGAQARGEWERVYTFEDGFIEMDAVRVFHEGDGVFRVTFRWSFERPQVADDSPRTTYRTRLEVYEFDCAAGLSRLYEVKLIDAKGGAVSLFGRNASGEWRKAYEGTMNGRLLAPACRLVESKVRPPEEPAPEAAEKEKALRVAFAFARRLERTSDFGPLVKEFFARDYLDGYLRDGRTNWLAPLERETAARASREELQRFHVAVLNVAYLGSTYAVVRYFASRSEPVPDSELIPPDLIKLIENHPYTAAHRGAEGGYEFLAEKIDGVERLRSYTDLLERAVGILRRRAAEETRSKERRVSLSETFEIGEPKVEVCAKSCLGLPAGTKLFRVNVHAFQLQLAEVEGEMKVVSVGPYSD